MQAQSIDDNNSPERNKERDYLLATSPPPGVSNAVSSSNEETKREKLRKFLILSSLFIAYMLISAAYSIISPFYPQEAEKNGLGALGVGLIMGASPLCVVILSPILGYFIPEIGLKFMLISGSFLVGGSFVLLGFLIDMYSRFEFILFSVLLRVVEGIGSAGYATALFTMATVLYPKSTGTVIGILEVGSGIGFLAGPPLGGLLYKLGGFLLPFVVTGGLVLLFIPVFIISLPNAQGKKQFIPPKTLLKLFGDVPFLVLCLDNVVLIGALGMLGPTLSPFLEKNFHLSQLGIGLVFLCGPSFYMVSSFAAGKLSDLFGPRYFIVGGFIVSGIAFVFLGPAQFVTTDSYLWISCVALCFVGIGLGFGVVPIYSDMLEIAKRVSPNIDQETLNGIISGLSSSTLSTGEFLGPVVGGALAQVWSFQTASMVFGQVLIAKGLLLFGITLIDRFARRTSTVYVKINE